MNNTNKNSLLLVAALLLTGLLSSCLKEKFDDCPRPFQVTIKALDIDQNDITQLGAVQQVILFVFDDAQQIVDAFELTAEQVKNRQPIDIRLEYPGSKSLTLVAWGNLDEKVDFSKINTVKQMQDLYVKLKSRNGIADSPGDLFHGALEVPVEFGGVEQGKSHVVEIGRKTAGVTIRAIELKQWSGIKTSSTRSTNGYSYVLRESLDTYDKDGLLTGNSVKYAPSATFSPKGDFITPIFYTFPTAPGKSFVVDILYNGKVVFTADKDSKGNPFVPEVGKTLNIIIVLSSELLIQSIVTPWDVVYQYVQI